MPDSPDGMWTEAESTKRKLRIKKISVCVWTGLRDLGQQFSSV